MAIGPLVQRIAAAIDPLHLEDVPGEDDPDGFDGLVNHGSYERLIATDWLLADEIPEEFERRATMREHLFLKTAKRERAHGLGSIVLFDAGPDQLGSPRLAHLAVLIALIRRAHRARANFSWAILQNPGVPFLHGSSESEMMELLRARTSKTVSGSAVSDWIKRGLEMGRPEEIWIVGSPRLQQISPNHVISRVIVDDILEPGVRQVSVEIHRLKGRPRKVLLDLPDNRLCARLLRDPYQAAVSVPCKLSTTGSPSGLIFAAGGRRLFTTLGDGTLMSFPVPSSPWETLGNANAKRHTLGKVGRIVAANRLGRSTIIVWAEETSLRISYVGKANDPAAGQYEFRFDQFAWPLENHQGLLFPCVRPPVPPGAQSTLFVLDAAENLFRLQPAAEKGVALLEESGVLALTSFAGIPAYLSVDRSKRIVEYTCEGPERKRTVISRDCHSAEKAFFGFGAHTQPPFCLFAIQKGPSSWSVFSSLTLSYEIQTEPTQEIVGVIQELNYPKALLSLREGRHVLTLKGSGWERTLFESPDSITHLIVSQSRPWIAYLTTKGDVTVYSLPLARSLCRYLAGDQNA